MTSTTTDEEIWAGHEPGSDGDLRFELANRLFFRLYQCANMLHKTGTRAVDPDGLTTQRWAVLGALSRPEAAAGMAIGDLARYLMVSRQSLAGVLRPLEADGLVDRLPDPADGRSWRLTMTDHGREVWTDRALPHIGEFYDQATAGLSVEDLSHGLHYLVRLLDNMVAIDEAP